MGMTVQANQAEREKEMTQFKLPSDLQYNRELIENPTDYVKKSGCSSWLYLNGEEFASMPGGMSYEQVQEAVPQSARVISDPPQVLNLALAQQHVEALEALARPTLISCRKGPRASAVAYMYAGLKAGATFEEVIEAAEHESAPFCSFPEYKEWVRTSMASLGSEIPVVNPSES